MKKTLLTVILLFNWCISLNQAFASDDLGISKEESTKYMNASAIHDFKEGSLQDRFTFPEVIERLNGIGAESYRIDLTGLRLTIYGERGDFRDEPLSPPLTGLTVSPTFSTDLIESGISTIVADNNYINFLGQLSAAGVSQYHVYLKGGVTHYISRNGELYKTVFRALLRK